MPGSADFTPTSSNLFEQVMQELVRDLESIGGRSVGSQADEERLLAEARQSLAEGRKALEDWTKNGLSQDFRTAYKNGTASPLSPAASALSTSHRKKFQRNGEAALADLDKWTADRLKYKRSFSDKAKLEKFIKQSELQLRGGSINQSDKKRLQSQIDQARGLHRTVSKAIESSRTAAGEKPEVLYRRRRQTSHGVRGTIASRQPADQYFNMLARTGHRDITNWGYLRGENDRGKQWFICSDGPDCGWAQHRDPDRANGKVVKFEEVIPYAHPHCQRTFHSSDGGPGSKRLKGLIADLTGAANTRAFKNLVKAGAILGQTAAVGTIIAQNPLVRQTMRDILADREIALGQFTKKILGDWVNFYERSESLVIKARGWEDNVLSRDQLRTETMSGVERSIIKSEAHLGNDLSFVDITREQAQVLKLRSTRLRRGELVERMSDYSDFIRHQEDIAAGGLRSVGAAARDEKIWGSIFENAGDMMKSTWARRGARVYNNAKRINRVVQKAIKENPQRAQVEAIRIVAGAVNPLPWLKATVGPVRFSVGMPHYVRQKLAKDLYMSMRGYEFRLAAEPTYAWRTNVPLLQRTISAQDIYESLLPRITYMGNPIHVSLMAVNGNLIPSFKLFPQQTFLKFLSFEGRLKSGVFDELISQARTLSPSEIPGYLRRELPRLGQDAIFNFDAFRNSPIGFGARMYGSELESLAVKFRQDDGLLRYTQRWYTRTAGQAKASKRALTLVPGLNGGYTLGAVVQDARKMEQLIGFSTMRGSFMEVAQTFGLKYDKFLEDVATHLNYYGVKLDDFHESMDFWLYKKGAAEGSHTLIWDTADTILDKTHSVFRSVLEDTFNRVKSIQEKRLLANTEIPFTEIRRANQYHGILAQRDMIPDDVWEATVDRSIRLNRHLDPAFSNEMASTINWWMENISSDIDELPIFMDDLKFRELYGATKRESTTAMAYNSKFNIILVPQEYAENWTALGKMVVKAQDVNWWNPRAAANASHTIMHEVGHHWSLTHLEPENLAGFWSKTFRAPELKNYWHSPPPDLEGMWAGDAKAILDSGFEQAEDFVHNRQGLIDAIDDWMNEPGIAQQINDMVSGYGATNAMELFAELFTEMATAPELGRLGSLGARAIGLGG
jgi:hypothetical protein